MVARYGLAGLLIGELFFFGLRTRAETLIWRNDEALWRGVLAQFPDSDLANEMLAQVLLKQRRIPEALNYAQRAVIAAPSAETRRNLGIVLVEAGKTQEAIGEFKLALQRKPDMADTQCHLAVALQRDGQLEEAIGHYQQALQADPNYADAHYNLGTALARLDRVPEAVAQWEEALRINPEYAEAHANLGAALEQVGKLEDAVEQYQQALRINPIWPRCSVDLAITLTSFYMFNSSGDAKPKAEPTKDAAQPMAEKTPIYRNIRISNLTATCQRAAGIIIGLSESPVADVILENVQITSATTGLKIQNAKGIQFKNVQITAQKGLPVIMENAEVTGMDAAKDKTGE